MPVFQVVKSKFLAEQVANLKQALQEKLSDGQKYVIRFYANISDYSNEQFIIDAEFRLIGRMMYNLEKEYDNFRVVPPSNITGIGMKWAEVSEDTAA